MSLRQSELKRVPIGENDNADHSLVPQARAAVMLGVGPVAPGVLGEILRKKVITKADGTNISGAGGFTYGFAFEGCMAYYGAAVANDALIVVQAAANTGGTLGTQVFKTTLAANMPQTVPDSIKVTAAAFAAVANNSGVVFASGKRVRAVQHKDELILVQEGGLTPLRYNGTAIYKLGLTTPAAPTGGAVAAGALSGDYQYWTTTADELGRESSPSPALLVTLNAQRKVVNWAAPGTTENVQKVYLYRTVAGGTVGYRVVEAGFTGPGAWTTTYNDNIADSAIENNTTSPLPGQNDPPLSASLVAKWKGRVVLNQATDRTVVQISNENMPGSFSVLGDELYPTDGRTMRVLTEHGDEVTALAGLGSALGIWTRRTLNVLFGDQPGNFAVKPLHDRGCVSPDAITLCDNRTAFPSEDGIYVVAFEDGFVVKKISGDFDGTFQAAAIQWTSSSAWPPSVWYNRQYRDLSAVGWFLQRKLFMAIAPYVYVFDFDTGGCYRDFMSDMPNSGGQNSGGYLSACVFHLERMMDVVVYNPGLSIYGGQNQGLLYVGSPYPLMTVNGSPRSYEVVYQVRGIDGAGVHRNSRKRLKRSQLFGSIKLAPEDPNAELAFSGTITCDVDGGTAAGGYTETYSFGIFGTFAAQFARDQLLGILVQQEWSAKCVGYLLEVRINATVMGRLSMGDHKFEYSRLD